MTTLENITCFTKPKSKSQFYLYSHFLFTTNCFQSSFIENHDVNVYILILSCLIVAFSRLELDNIILFTFGKDVHNQAVEIGYIIYILLYVQCACTLCMRIKLQALYIHHFTTNKIDSVSGVSYNIQK